MFSMLWFDLVDLFDFSWFDLFWLFWFRMNGQGCFSLTMFKQHIQTVFTNLFQLAYNYVESKLLLVVMVYLLKQY